MGNIPLTAPEEVSRKSFSFATIRTWISNCRDFGRLKICLIRQGRLKKYCVKNASRSTPNEMKQDNTLSDFLDVKGKVV